MIDPTNNETPGPDTRVGDGTGTAVPSSPAPAVTMKCDADRLRAQIPSSTDPARLEKLAQAAEQREWQPIGSRPPPGTSMLGAWGTVVTETWETRNLPRLWWHSRLQSFVATPPDAWMPLPVRLP